MNKFIKPLLSLGMAGLMLLSVAPISVYANSTGSVAADADASVSEITGQDTEQNQHTEYQETDAATVSSSTRSSEVYVTMDDGDILIKIPKVVILSGAKDNTYEDYRGYYTVEVLKESDFSGLKKITVEPDTNVSLSQRGKTIIDDATIKQEKIQFSYSDAIEGDVNTTTGVVYTDKLTAGSWKGVFNFNCSYNDPSLNALPEYFTWAEDVNLKTAHLNNSVEKDYPYLTIAEEKPNSTYSYPNSTQITGLTPEGVTWIENNGGELYIPTYASSIVEVSDMTTAPFAGINSNYGSVMDTVEYIYIPENIKDTSQYTFAYLDGLQRVDCYSESVASVSFACSQSLKTVDLHNKAVSIGASSFLLCKALENVFGTNNVVNVGTQGFASCSNLTYIDSLQNCISFGNNSFEKCYKLKNVEINENVENIGKYAFFKTGVIKNWDEYQNCEFGIWATSNQVWNGNPPSYTIKPSNNNHIVGFSQYDPEWASLLINGAGSNTYQQSGCGACCLATLYNYYYNENMSPLEIIELLRSMGSLTDFGFSEKGALPIDASLALQALGLEVDYKAGGNSHAVFSSYEIQPLIDALEAGKIAIISIANTQGSSNGHSVIAYGMTADGKLKIVNSAEQIRIARGNKTQKYSTVPQYMECLPESLLSGYGGYTIVDRID